MKLALALLVLPAVVLAAEHDRPDGRLICGTSSPVVIGSPDPSRRVALMVCNHDADDFMAISIDPNVTVETANGLRPGACRSYQTFAINIPYYCIAEGDGGLLGWDEVVVK